VDVVIVEFTNVHGTISPLEGAGTVLLPIFIVSLVFSAIGPCLYTESVLLVFSPLASVLSTIHVHIGASAVSLVIEPLSFIDITI
jgi:hypothetical protein